MNSSSTGIDLLKKTQWDYNYSWYR